MFINAFVTQYQPYITGELRNIHHIVVVNGVAYVRFLPSHTAFHTITIFEANGNLYEHSVGT